jgi:hypothetical protein
MAIGWPPIQLKITDGKDSVDVALLAKEKSLIFPIVSFLSLTTGFSVSVSARR